VRQSKRIKDTGISQLKMGGQAQNKVGLDIETEGNSPLNQNSFAVLANPHIINLA